MRSQFTDTTLPVSSRTLLSCSSPVGQCTGHAHRADLPSSAVVRLTVIRQGGPVGIGSDLRRTLGADGGPF
eukprot:4724450-Pyramimonas_sp.AAC.1